MVNLISSCIKCKSDCCGHGLQLSDIFYLKSVLLSKARDYMFSELSTHAHSVLVTSSLVVIKIITFKNSTGYIDGNRLDRLLEVAKR